MDKEIDPVAIDRNASIPDQVIKGLGELGVLGMTIPKEYGGRGCRNTLLQGSRSDSQALRLDSPVCQCPPKHRIESLASLWD